MREFTRPRVVVSKCLGFASCRWNGLTIDDAVVESLKTHVDYTPVCPEVEIGLGVPREPIRVVKTKEGVRLMQPSTGRDVSSEMTGFADKFLGSLGDVDGFILKSKSPSCGMKDVKVYPGTEKVAALGKAWGFFGKGVMDRFGHLAVEDEARLSDYRIREHFLTKLFALAEFRNIRKGPSMGGLVKFHTNNKLLLMAYNHKSLRDLGRIVANHEKKPVEKVFDDYAQELFKALAKAPRYTSNVNVLMHALGYFSKGLQSSEKKYFLEMLEKYRVSRVPFSVPLSIIRSFVVRFEEPYLKDQTFFEPYPEDLMLVTDSGKGRLR